MPQGPFNTLVAKFLGATTYQPLALDKQSGLLSSLLHGDKYQQAYLGNLFYGSNQAGATISNALAPTYTGLCLSNPAASGKNVVVRGVAAVIAVAPAGMQPLGLISGWLAAGVTVHTTALIPKPGTVNGSATSIAKLDAACTLVGTPAWDRWMAGNIATTNNTFFSADLEGGLIIPPGGYVAIGSPLAAGPAAGLLGTFEWEEVNP